MSEPLDLCDCERSHNGLGLRGRLCDCPFAKTNVMEDDMDDRSNLDEFLEKTRVAVAARKKVDRKRKQA